MGVLIRFLIFGFILFLLVRGLKSLLLASQKDQKHEPDLKKTKTKAPKDPYKVLGINRASSEDDIKRAYRARLAEYHPDKVSHLGEDLQQLALIKSQEISWAYKQLQQ